MSTADERTAGIVVGVDESEGSAAALRWALREAQRRGVPLTAVLAWGYLEQHHVGKKEPFDPRYGEEDARAALAAVVARDLGADAGGVQLRTESDLPVPALLRAAEGAVLLVVGARGLGGFEGLLLGSVSQQVLHHAPCPVAIVRGQVARPRPEGTPEHLVVGVDGSAPARAALAWAVEEARLRSARLTAVHAHLVPYFSELPDESGLAWDQGTDERVFRATLDAAVDAVDTSGVAVERLLVADSPAPAILGAAADADLVVVGSRGYGGFRGVLLGSVSNHVTHHAPCPVVVLRAPS
jgi:nucleotide-binding universal stress UspA family protein